MYWWNYRKLAVALREGTIKPWQLKLYWVLFVALYLAVILLYCAYPPAAPTDARVLSFNYAMPFSALIGSFLITYVINRSVDNCDFWKRLVCITFPVNNRYFVILLLPLLILMTAEAVYNMAQICDNITLEECAVTIGEPRPGYISILAYAVSVLIYFHWLRDAFLYACGRKTV